ncbi:Uncharacterised protein [Mycobacterium tuberculosis]|uniref:Uncharacterized protein n=1 Tax=Mycobacterium tuberculosis TaxID=1773 RepID=A0A655DJZ2_MYCTX|nr:Uncharacterised protein [Mycobacterium tuberculosis]CFB24059.1 Uncharacterised protein [Mycobacterium tuberculosis]CFB31521.1 Uncharacterised protein [Mycobacterium tuberculosis]CFB41483.1 Uncharacterised protein [Mycobacterium tuberculosis]CFB89971.1 Uncharacterised protein [Mycobacterium tuberculosis]
MVVVDQADQIAEGFDGAGVIERELAVALEHTAGRADVVKVDGLRIVGGVVSPLADPPSIESWRVGGASIGVDGEPSQHRAQGVVIAATPSQVVHLRGVDTGGSQQIGVVEHGNSGVRQLRHTPQDAGPSELVNHRRLPVGGIGLNLH